MIRLRVKLVLLFASITTLSYAQFSDCSTGLLQMPTADMQSDGTFMVTNLFLNKHSLPSSGWDYNTFQYGISISLWERLEIGYVCTIFNGAWSPKANKTERERIMRNQDRHFVARVRLLKEGDFGQRWMPALVLGVSDPVSAIGRTGIKDYTNISDFTDIWNGFFNRNYVILSKHFTTHWGALGVHAGFQFNFRMDYSINGPCVGLNWQPVWMQQKGLLDGLDIIAEYDSRTVNIGFIASIWQNRFEAMFELQNFRWVNFGLRYKLRLK